METAAARCIWPVTVAVKVSISIHHSWASCTQAIIFPVESSEDPSKLVRAVKTLEPGEMAERFRELEHRVVNGRANEIVTLNATGRHPSTYTRMIRGEGWGPSYRYVST